VIQAEVGQELSTGSDPGGSDTGSTDLGSSFVGTWKGTDYDGEPLTLILNQNLIFLLIFEWGKTPTLTGSFTVSGNTITLFVPGETMTGTINGIKIFIKNVNFTKTSNGTGNSDGGSDPGGSYPGGTDPGSSEPGGSTPSTPTSFTVSNATEWNSAVSAINAGGNNKSYTITVTGDFSLPGGGGLGALPTFSPTGLTVTINGNKTISLSSAGYLIRVATNQSIILQDVNLKGMNNTRGLVETYGQLTMQGSASIYGNSAGVAVYDGGSFTMKGGTISGNDLGVGIPGGTFFMTGGQISGNTHGGVHVYDGPGSTFTMSGGSISGNTNYDGGGVYVETYGDFTMNGGSISGNIADRGGGV